jgi:putative ABC transport system substrate-binding protein
MKRREFVTLFGGVVGWPFAANAQQTMPVIGFLGSQSPDTMAYVLPSFWQGLGEWGFAEEKMSRSNIAGRRIAMTGCQRWLPSWFEIGSL